jgi:hypothetical protein
VGVECVASALELGLIGVVSAATALIATTPGQKPHPEKKPGKEQVESGTIPSTTTHSDDQHQQPRPSSPSSREPPHQNESAPREPTSPSTGPTQAPTSPYRTEPKPIEPIVERKDPSSDFLLSLGSPIATSPTTSHVTHSVISPTSYTPISIPQQQAPQASIPSPPLTQSDLVLPPPTNAPTSPQEEDQPIDGDNLVPTTLPDSTASSASSLSDAADSQASIRSIPPTPGPDAFNSAPPTPLSSNEDQDPERHQLVAAPVAVPTTLSRISSHASSDMSAPPLETAPPEVTPDNSRVAVTGQEDESTRSLSPQPESIIRPTSPSVEQRERDEQELMDREEREKNDNAVPVVAAVPLVAAVEEKSELRDESLYAAPAPQNGGLHRDVSMTRGFLPVPTSYVTILFDMLLFYALQTV